MKRRGLLAALPACVLLPATAQTPAWPARPVRLVEPYPVGTANEVFARMVAQRLGDRWAQPVLVDVITGAGGVVGTQVVSRASADGYTLGWIANAHAINAALYPSLPFDPVAGFRPIAGLASAPFVLTAGPSFQGQGLAELIATGKSKPDTIEYASLGNGSGMHLMIERLAFETGMKLRHIPYKATGQLIADLMGGRVQFAALGSTLALAQLATGKVRALAITTARRSPLLPDVPTIGETVPGFEFGVWMGLIAPAGTPDAVVRKVSADALAMMRDPALQESMVKMGIQPEVLDADQFARRISSEIDMFRKVVAQAGIKID